MSDAPQATRESGLAHYMSGAGATRVRLVVVTTQPLVRWALARIAADSDDLVSVGDAVTVSEARRLIESQRPNVVVIDGALEDDQGWRLAGELRDRDSELGIVLMCTQTSDELILRAVDIGASAFVSTAASVPDLLAAIRHAAVSGAVFAAAGLREVLHRRMSTPTSTGLLSPRELDVLLLLRDGRSVPEVAVTLRLGLGTAKTYVSRIYEKLGATNRAQALMRAVELNLFDIAGELPLAPRVVTA